jgi:hypothetical protein
VIAVGRNSPIAALICATSFPVRFGGRSCRRSARFEREAPITSATVFVGNHISDCRIDRLLHASDTSEPPSHQHE